MVILLAPTQSQYSLGAGNYQQPQLPTANTADADFDTKSYHLSIELLSTRPWCSGFVYIRKACMLRRAEGNLQNGMLVITNQSSRGMMVIYISWWRLAYIEQFELFKNNL